MKNGYMESVSHDLNMLQIKCEHTEFNLMVTPHFQAKLVESLDNNLLEYVKMALDGALQEYCDSLDHEIRI